MNKDELRQIMRKKALALTPAYTGPADRSITEQVLADPAFRNAGKLFVYISMPHEPDTSVIIREAFAMGKQVYVPKCFPDGMMKAVRITPASRFVQGALRIPEPEDLSEEISAEEADLIIIPCVSASLDGKRLGHGKGYYDRYLGTSRTYKICLCYRELLCEEIPMTDMDIYMDKVITDAG